MLESIRGILKTIEPTKVVVENQGLGYRVGIPLNAYSKLPQLEQEVFLYVSLVIREDSQTLFGFLTKEERDLFEQLLSISGIGPKTSLSIIGHFELGDFHNAICKGDVRRLHQVPGIGKKMAERLLIELKDKIGHVAMLRPSMGKEGEVRYDAIRALVHLGYHSLQAEKAVQEVLREKEPKNASELITLALRKVK